MAVSTSIAAPEPGEYVSFARLAHRCGCSWSAIADAVKRKKLAIVAIAGRRLVEQHEAERFAKAFQENPHPLAANWRAARAAKQREGA